MNSVDQPLSVITFNVSGLPSPPSARKRMREIGKQIEAMDATLANLQEVHTYGLLRALKTSLPSFPYVSYEPSIIGPRGALVTFSKQPIKEHVFISLTSATHRLDKGLIPSRATIDSLHKGVLVTKLANRPVTILNTHLSANTDGDWSKVNRFYPIHKAQLDFLLQLTQQYDTGNASLILSGDFNLAKDCDLYEYFYSKGKWVDPFRDDSSPTFHSEFLSPDRKPRRIDYIFAKNATNQPQAAKARVAFEQRMTLQNGKETYLSNHKGLYSRFVFAE